jgi:predicted extracellular nuclease
MFGRRLPSFVAVVALVLALVPLARPAAALSTTIVISQIYGGGGNSGATLRNDFIELFNRGTATVNVSGWSVQYASATGTTWAVTALSGSIGPGQYYLVQEAAGAGGSVSLPPPDATGTTAMSATSGKVALANSTASADRRVPDRGGRPRRLRRLRELFGDRAHRDVEQHRGRPPRSGAGEYRVPGVRCELRGLHHGSAGSAE